MTIANDEKPGLLLSFQKKKYDPSGVPGRSYWFECNFIEANDELDDAELDGLIVKESENLLSFWNDKKEDIYFVEDGKKSK